MAQIQKAENILNQCTRKLHSSQIEARNISKNKDVIAWQKVNIDSFADIIEGLGLPENLREFRDAYPQIAKKVLQEITTLQNNIANLKADIKLGPLPPSIALPKAQEIHQQVGELLPLVNKLQQCKTGLETSTITLKKNLNLNTLLPLARACATGKRKSVFETGFSIYLLTTRDPGFEDEDQVNMYSYFDKASKLQNKFAKLNIQGLSKTSAAMISNQTKLCNEGLQEVKDFILFVESYVHKDMENINQFHAQLSKVTRQPITEILFNIPTETEKVSACIRDFVHKKFFIEEIDRVAQLILMIDQFYLILKNHFISYLAEQETLENGLLNPATLSTARANTYFMGLPGFIRMIRIFLDSLSKKEPISPEILQKKLQLILTDCVDLFGQSKEDQRHISEYIESHFNQYSAPFPKNYLIELTKKCLITYRTILEKVMYRYKLKEEGSNNYSLGRLSGKIEVRMSNLAKYRKKLTPS